MGSIAAHFPEHVKTAVIKHDPNIKVEDMKDLEYSKEDDETFENWTRDQVVPMCHRMYAPRSLGGKKLMAGEYVL